MKVSEELMTGLVMVFRDEALVCLGMTPTLALKLQMQTSLSILVIQENLQ